MSESLARAIKTEAQRLGFLLVGITTPDQPPHFADYERWLSEGRQGEMSYLSTEHARQRRADPLQILPECRSILALGMRYPSPASSAAFQNVSPQDRESRTGRVAAYAWGDDYHEVLPERLKQIVIYIEAQVGGPVPNRWYTDTGPILERDLAQRAGLGWIGKNTNLIHPSLGSYFLLAEILLGLDLEPDLPFTTDHCGSCTRCIEACPTDCILPDRSLDARRCISYLTIELKGAIPLELRPRMGNWVFGCDICQQVCPWNQRFVDSSLIDARRGAEVFSVRPDVPRPDLISELSLSPEEFNRKYKGSPVKRARRGGYLRNVAVALGNARDPEAVPALGKALLEDTDPLVRAHAAWALGEIGGQEALSLLELAAKREHDPTVLNEIHLAIPT